MQLWRPLVSLRKVFRISRTNCLRKRGRKSAALTLDSVERQVESQQVLLRNAKDQLSASKAQTTAFKKNLEKPRRLGMMQRGLERKWRGLQSRPSKMDMI